MLNKMKARTGWGGKALLILSGAALTVALFTSPAQADPKYRDRDDRRSVARNDYRSKKDHRYKKEKVRSRSRKEYRHEEHRGLQKRHRQDKYFRYDRRHDRSVFYVPRHMDRSHYRFYRPFYHGRVYHPGHRHHHIVYHFPVYTDVGYVYAPHYYCDGGFFLRGDFLDDDFHGRFSISIGF